MVHWLKKRPFALALVGALALGACDDDPTGVDDDHNHADDVESVVLTLNGGVVSEYDGDAGTWSAPFPAVEGQETAHIDVGFFDHDGAEVVLDADFYLEVEVADASIAEFEQDTPGEFGGHIHGEAVGSTTMEFRLMHGAMGSGHADFITGPLTVTVTAPVAATPVAN